MLGSGVIRGSGSECVEQVFGNRECQDTSQGQFFTQCGRICAI